MEKVTFSYSRSARLRHRGSVVALLLLFMPLSVMGVRRFQPYVRDESASIFDGPTSILDRLTEIVGLAVLIWVTVWLLQHIRYWNAYRSTYTLSADGIEVETPAETARLMWAEIDRADYIRPFGIARLTSRRLSEPVILFLTRENEQAEERESFVRNLLGEKLETRYRTKWL